jgi:lipoprotein-anchoring transpeptidase ErfK/SrfK
MRWRLPFCAIAGLTLGTATPPPDAAPGGPVPLYAAVEPFAADAPNPSPLPPMAVPPGEPVPEPPSLAGSRPAVPAAVPPMVLPGDGPVRIVVSLSQQKAFVYKAGALLAASPVSTGRRGHETPTGIFPILEKQVHHRSNKYSNAPMPFMQRLTPYGIALHAGHLPGYPASHGCIRLPWGFAKRLYGLTGYGTTVTITRVRVRAAKADAGGGRASSRSG